MIVCPNCNHQNPEGATQCEACYTPLPVTINCPNCGVTVQADAAFCGQCGYNLQPQTVATVATEAESSGYPPIVPTVVSSVPGVPDLIAPDPLVIPEPVVEVKSSVNLEKTPSVPEPPPVPVPVSQVPAPVTPPAMPGVPEKPPQQTQLQQHTARLLHIQTNQELELPQSLTVIHIGKPNEWVPPDIDVSGFPNSEIVSRTHADIRVEGDVYYIEDVGSSNGTYINNNPLAKGDRHRLRPGDRIALGKGDLVSFLFQRS